ncbi:MAG: hypothetical protein U0599_16350 [Vicinamibacteria bacterium]
MRRLAWVAAGAVAAAVFVTYGHRLGVEPVLAHDDYEYTYPSFSFAAHGHYGSPLLGPGYNIERRTYSLTVYYYATVHGLLIRALGAGVEAIPLANLLHFALLAGLGVFFLLRRDAWLGAAVFLAGLVGDTRMVEAARHGRPEMTAGFCLSLACVALWPRVSEGRRSALLLLLASAALAAGTLSHTSVAFFGLALAAALALPLGPSLRKVDVTAVLAPFAGVAFLGAYFVLTDSLANVRGQMAPGAGDVMLLQLASLARAGDLRALGALAAEFLRTHGSVASWAVAAAALLAPRVVDDTAARAARFFGALYVLFFGVNFVFLKHFVTGYQCLYLGTFYLALAWTVEAAAAGAARRWGGRAALSLRAAGALIALGLAISGAAGFRRSLDDAPRAPYSRVRSALVAVLRDAGAIRGDRVFVPSPFGFHLTDDFTVRAQPAPKYYRGRWSPAFRDGLRAIWGDAALARHKPAYLCHAMGLAYTRPKWVMAWDSDYGVMWPWWSFLRRFEGLPGMEIREAARAEIPWPYGGTVRVYRLDLSDAVESLDRSVNSAQAPCP